MPNFKAQACPRSTAKESQLQAKKRSLIGLAGAIGKLEFLNDFGAAGGKVRKTLETLALSSEAIRRGSPVPDDVGGGTVGGTTSGRFADSILTKMGLGNEVQSSVAQFDPGAVNGAVGAAKVLAEDVKNGRFKMNDIPNRIQDFQNLEGIASKIFRKPRVGTSSEDYQKFACRPSPYAVDLVDRAPKQNFLFVVEIKLAPEYEASLASNLVQNALPNDISRNLTDNTTTASGRRVMSDNVATQLAFLVKSTTRPSITYEYEDVNYYNYRTKAIRKATFNPINMRFIDDQLNSAIAFYALYTKAMSPVTNTDPKDSKRRAEQEALGSFYYGSRLSDDLTNSGIFSESTASIGPLTNNRKTLIEEISIYQFGKNANTITAFTMINPKITNFSPSDTTMEDSGVGQEISFDFEYDYFHIDPEIPMTEFGEDKLLKLTGEASGGGAGAKYPILHTQSGTTDATGGIPGQQFFEATVKGVGSDARETIQSAFRRE